MEAMRRRRESRSSKNSIYSIEISLPTQGFAADNVPYEILLEIFDKLVDHAQLDRFLDGLGSHRPLALSSLLTGEAFWSPKSFSKTNLVNAALTCKNWSEAASSVLSRSVQELSRFEGRETGSVKVCAWVAGLQGKRKTLLALGSLRVASRKRTSISAAADFNVFSSTSVSLLTLTNLRALFLSTTIVNAIHKYSEDSPLAGLESLRSVAISNIHPSRIYTALNNGTIDVESVCWILKGTRVESLELYDVCCIQRLLRRWSDVALA